MKDELKFYLLAEECGWNCSSYAYSYREGIKDLTSYKVLIVNMIQVNKDIGNKAKELVSEYEELNLNPNTLHEAFITDTKLNYLALHSFPEYYLNPFTIAPSYNGEITTIGELIFDIEGVEMPLNQVIIEDKTTKERKLECISNQLDYYAYDMNAIAQESIEKVKTRAFTSGESKSTVITTILEIALFIIVNFLLLFFFTYPYDGFKACLYIHSPNKFMTYLVYIYPLFILFYDLTFAFYHSYKAKISEPYNYARRFLRRNAKKVYEDINKKRDELYEYIKEGLDENRAFADDIKRFSMLSTSYVDFENVLHVDQLQQKKAFKFLKNLTFIITTITALLAVFTLIIYLLGLWYGETI